MTICPIQWFGLGDVVFEQTVVRKIAGPDNAILWPVHPKFVEGLNRAYPDIAFVDYTKFNIDYNRRDDYTQDGIRYLPLRFADQLMNLPYSCCMSAKYQYYGMDYKSWRHQAVWIRDRKKENELYSLVVNHSEYNLVNTYFGSDSQLQVSVGINNGLPNVEMKTIEGFSLFDWAKIIENASNIAVVNSSIMFLLELLELKAKEIHLFARKPIENDFKNVDYLFTKDYILHI